MNDNNPVPQSGSARFFVLNDAHRPVPASRGEWEAFKKAGRHILGLDRIGRVEVITEFLGTEPRIRALGEAPYLFGTLIKDPDEEGEEPWFYQSWKEAADTHRQVVADYRGERVVDLFEMKGARK